MMTGRASTLTRVFTVGISAAALTLATASTAMAAPGDWTQLSQLSAGSGFPRMSNLVEPTVARFGSTLQVIWGSEMSSSSGSYFTAMLDGAGNVTTPSREIISNWKTLTDDPTVTTIGGQRFLAFSGLADGLTGAEYYATSSDGLTWTKGAGSLSAAQSAYTDEGSDLLDNAGTPVWVGNAHAASLSWHVGISPTDPAPAGSDGTLSLTGCCSYYAAAARDEASGAVYSAFYSNISTPTVDGIQVGQILPTQGTFAQAPGSSNGSGDSVDPGQRVAMAARTGGGVYVAYKLGYPTVTGIRVLQVGTGNTMDVPGSAGAKGVALSGGPDGRLWVTWISNNKIKAVHTNAAATKFGSVGSWGAPHGTSTMWHVTSSAVAGGLDIVTSTSVAEKINVWHTQAVRTLTVRPNPARVSRGHSVTFTVTDAGDPVAGASVKFGSITGLHTNAAGKITLNAPGSAGSTKVTAKKAGYNPGTTTVRVR